MPETSAALPVEICNTAATVSPPGAYVIADVTRQAIVSIPLEYQLSAAIDMLGRLRRIV